jgi:multisubunit Na+/H+ antiporter MnhB subunit
MTIQFVIGLVLLILYAAEGAFNARVQIEHAIYGLIATALAHMTRMFRNQPDDRRFRNALLLVLASLLVALFSIWRLRGSVLAGL